MKLDRHFFHVFHALILSHWLLTVTHLKHISQTNLISVIIASPSFCSSAVCRSLHLQLHSCASLNSELKFFTSVFTAFSEKNVSRIFFFLRAAFWQGHCLLLRPYYVESAGWDVAIKSKFEFKGEILNSFWDGTCEGWETVEGGCSGDFDG